MLTRVTCSEGRLAFTDLISIPGTGKPTVGEKYPNELRTLWVQHGSC
jgi:hypothetical protein